MNKMCARYDYPAGNRDKNGLDTTGPTGWAPAIIAQPCAVKGRVMQLDLGGNIQYLQRSEEHTSELQSH